MNAQQLIKSFFESDPTSSLLYKGRVAKTDSEGLDPSMGKWCVICDRHGTILGVQSKSLASRSKDTREFCQDCRDELHHGK